MESSLKKMKRYNLSHDLNKFTLVICIVWAFCISFYHRFKNSQVFMLNVTTKLQKLYYEIDKCFSS